MALKRKLSTAALIAASVVCLLVLVGCNNSGKTSGSAFVPPAQIEESSFSQENMQGTAAAGVDTSSANKGYAGAVATSEKRLKLLVTCGDNSCTYALSGNGTPLIVPLTFGDGLYTFRIMQNTTDNNYMQIFSTSAHVMLDSEFEPYVRPNVYCAYDANSEVVKKATELTQNAQNEGDALRAIYEWVCHNITYDQAKAAELAGESGYIPNPDETLHTGSGICFDYASLTAAMLRSQDIPCKIVTGYVLGNDAYHAWNEVWIDGSWQSIYVTVTPQTWIRIDTTFAANISNGAIANGISLGADITYEPCHTY